MDSRPASSGNTGRTKLVRRRTEAAQGDFFDRGLEVTDVTAKGDRKAPSSEPGEWRALIDSQLALAIDQDEPDDSQQRMTAAAIGDKAEKSWRQKKRARAEMAGSAFWAG